MSDRDLPASADLVRQARSNLLNEVVWPSLAVQRLVFIRGTSGIGDSLNGLVSAYWLSHILGAELSLCWPEATHMPWRVRLEPAGCVAPKARYERLARLLVRHAPPGTKTQTRTCADPAESRIFNTHVVVRSSGEIACSYRKIHLFDVPMTGLVESKQALPGEELVACDSPVGKLGVTVCYDLRFPELYQKLTFVHGCQLLLIPSAFAMKTGEAHWETLLRARAIETQTYVVAAAQAGLHNEDGNKRRSYGHAMAIDPWGTVLAAFGADDAGVQTFEVDLALLDQTRDNMPMHAHRRYDLYGVGPHQAGEAPARKRKAEDDGLFFG